MTTTQSASALLEECQLGSLLGHLLDIVIQETNAHLGTVLLQDEGHLYIEASWTSEQEKADILQHILLSDTSSSYPIDIFEHVRKEQDLVFLTEPSQIKSRFGQDRYLLSEHVQQLLCCPIILKENLIGILYLENGFLEEVFSFDFVDSLQELLLYAAIAIQNAKKYEALQAKLESSEKRVAYSASELQKVHQLLVRTEKMASLGTLVSGVAHEINNPASFTHSGATNLHRRLQALHDMLFEMIGEDDEEVAEVRNMFEKEFFPLFQNLDAILDGTRRIKNIVSDLRTFSRLDDAEPISVSVKEGLESTISLVRSNFKNTVRFERDFRFTGEIKCWPAQLNQVFMNMMVNASQSILEKKEATGSNEMGLLQIRTFKQGNMVVIQFEDSGAGMTDEVKQRIFEPFYTTKIANDGMGLGLAISQDIVKKHGGYIELETEVGKGTTFSIFLPLISS